MIEYFASARGVTSFGIREVTVRVLDTFGTER